MPRLTRCSPERAFSIAEGYFLWLAAVVQAHPPAARALADPEVGAAFKRMMVRTAILLAGAAPEADDSPAISLLIVRMKTRAHGAGTTSGRLELS